MLAALTGIGLSASAGLNAYIPLLLVGITAGVTDRLVLAPGLSWLSSGWAIAVISVLLLVELIVDKVPIVDHVNDVIQTVVRPAVGGVVFAATRAAGELDDSLMARLPAWVGVLLGVGTALITHVLKTGARPVVNTTTVGLGAPVVSTLEDAGSLGLSLVAVFLPVLVLLGLLILALFGWWILRARRRLRRRALSRADAGSTVQGRRSAP